MKKKLLYLLLLFGILFCIKINVNAKEILSSDISPRTYIIGTYEFTENTTLTTRHIMLASKTIDGNTLNDMIIYYKNPRGKWINGLTGETVEVSEKFNIEYVDLIKFLTTPTLENILGDETSATLSITSSGYYLDSNNLSKISGWELYEKTTDGYSKITEGTNYTYQMELVPGETKTFVARVYKDKENGDRIYSEYSNELEVTREKLQTPTLANDPSDLSGAHLSMAVEGYYASGEDALKEITGWELYEKTENGYVTIANDSTYSHNVSMDQGTTKTFIARVYYENENVTKTYSEYSNEVVVTIEKIKVPTLTFSKNNDKMTLSIIAEGTYKDETEQNKITGWELYEKGETNTLITSDKPYTYEMDIPYGETKTYYARIYIVDVYNNKVYSENSAELVINEKLPTPTLSNDYSYTDGAKLSILTEGYYGSDVEKKNMISGWELYEKTESGYSILTEGTNYTYELAMESGSSKTFVSRVYKNINGEKVYSDYSNEITIERILIGDANCDGEISSLDSSIISRYVDNLSVDKISLKNADVNLDGEVNEVDSTIILYYIAHKDSEDAITLPYDAGKVYKITYDLDGGVLNDGSHNPGSYAEISLPFSLSIPTKDGYEFIGWTGSNGDTPELEVRIPKGTTGNLNYKANWNLK